MDAGLVKYEAKSGCLAIVGQKISRDEVKPVSDAPSRPLSRTSRAESIGSLADYSQHGGYWGANIVPADYGNTHHQVGLDYWCRMWYLVTSLPRTISHTVTIVDQQSAGM